MNDELFNKIDKTLSDYENGTAPVSINDLYCLLITVRNRWNDVPAVRPGNDHLEQYDMEI